MTRRLEALGDRLLSLVVPRVKAGACYCYWTSSGCPAPQGYQYYKRCYHCSGGPSGCGYCQAYVTPC